ncbi:TadE-like protein [Desulfonatronum thiosulfatophilum]|uniref:TadE-like protein n=1 Tax=Desulfonatronum thiosulfatophilum TaxID=617002 RepID=A0A1G6C8B8_9BACT|nr:TadE/TadG family type IV pilus assembly protein [Desulfonatronum thiosulfatophilum]SDB29058.1 TadE-like protein [Desulfonatronum thiosulfatophilum]
MFSKKSYAQQNGIAMIEFAIMLPLLLLFFLGTLEFGLLYYNKQVITNATREGARSGITGKNDDKIIEMVGDYIENAIFLTLGTDDYSTKKISASEDGNGNYIVSVNYEYSYLLLGVFTEFFKVKLEPINVNTQTIMKMEPGST